MKFYSLLIALLIGVLSSYQVNGMNLSQNIDPFANLALKEGVTLLHVAAESGNTESIQILLRMGSNVNAEIEDALLDGLTALHLTAHRGHVRAAQILLTAGAQVSAAPLEGVFCGYTPLHAASEAGHLNMVELLVRNGANVNACPLEGRMHGRTPLYDAVMSNHIEIVRYLLNVEGVDINAVRADGDSALNIASLYYRKEIFDMLLSKNAVVSDDIKIGIEKDDKCCVCQYEFEAGEHIAELPCAHFFHYDCSQGWENQDSGFQEVPEGDHCPLCRDAGNSVEHKVIKIAYIKQDADEQEIFLGKRCLREDDESEADESEPASKTQKSS